jgi:hypothetical protein
MLVVAVAVLVLVAGDAMAGKGPLDGCGTYEQLRQRLQEPADDQGQTCDGVQIQQRDRDCWIDDEPPVPDDCDGLFWRWLWGMD